MHAAVFPEATPAAVSPEVAADAAEPPEAAVLSLIPCMVVAPSNAIAACHVTVKGTITELSVFVETPDGTAVEPLEVAASAAESPEVSVVSTYQLSPCPVTAKEAVCELSPCPVTAKEAVCELSPCPVTDKEAVCELLLCPVTAKEAVCELSPCPVTAMEAVFESSSCSITAMEAVCELATEAINEPSLAHVTASYVLLSCPELATEASCELPVPSFTTEGVMGELPDCCIESLGAVHELLALPVMNPETINTLHVCPVTPVISKELTYELPSHPVSVSERVDECFVFPATVLETMNALPVLSVSALPVLSVSVLPRSRSPPWFPGQSAFLCWSSIQVRWSSAPVWWSSAPPWSSTQVWRSSAPPWGSSVRVRWSSALPWRTSAPPWWAPVPSALPWWAPVPSALPWWAPVLSAPPWWAPGPSAPPWWAPVPSTPSWLPALPTLPRSTVTTLPRGPGPPSLPLFRLRSTALLDYIGASGSRSLGGAMSRILSMHCRSLTTRGHSFTTLTLTPHYCCHSPSNCISHHPLH